MVTEQRRLIGKLYEIKQQILGDLLLKAQRNIENEIERLESREKKLEKKWKTAKKKKSI